MGREDPSQDSPPTNPEKRAVQEAGGEELENGPSESESDIAREIRERWRVFFQKAPVYCYFISPKGTIIDVNDTALSALGYAREDLVGGNLEKIYASDSILRMKSLFKSWKKTGSIKEEEMKIVTKTGEVRTVLLSASAITDKNGNLLYSLSVQQDITERTRITERLRDSEERYRTLFETMIQGVVYQDASGAIISANPAAQEILGMTLDQMMGRESVDPRWRSIREDGSDFPGDVHPAMISLRTGEPVDNVVMGVFNHTMERYTWINVCAVPLFKPNEEKPFQVYTTFEDITERRALDIRLREKGTAIASSVAGIVFANLEGIITFVNPAFLKLWGYKNQSEVLGRSVLEFWTSQDDAINALGSCMEGNTWVGELEAKKKDESSFLAQVSAGPIFDEDGRPASLMGSFVDITELKIHEIEREQQHRELELYSSLIRHDIGNDLQVLMAHLETIEIQQPTGHPGGEDLLVPVKAAASRITQLLHAFSRPIATTGHNLVEMIEEIASNSELIHSGMKVKVTADRTAKRIQLSGHRLLNTVFENLLRNSAEHGGTGVKVEISVRRVNGNAVINICDDGPGISGDIISRLFERGASSNGGGLGLYLCRQILKAYKGSIDLTVSPSVKGAAFRITIPI
ncbi:MAG: PAS domain-containing sensor histidine kinase [Candidatus Thorarchaeota archaeon]